MVGRKRGGWRIFTSQILVGLIRFYSALIRLAILLALLGQLKHCTLVMMGAAAESSERGMISYSKFTRPLTN
jgi:hypothetical protein